MSTQRFRGGRTGLGKKYNEYFLSGMALLVFGIVVLGITLVTNQGDLTSAILVLASIGSFVAGIVILALYKGDPIDPLVINHLPTQGIINICTMWKALNIQGKAIFVPEKNPIPTVRQVNPATVYKPMDLSQFHSFIVKEGYTAALSEPLGIGLLQHLIDKNNLQIPSEKMEILRAAEEVVVDVLELGDSAKTEIQDGVMHITISNYRLFPSCQAVRSVSPGYCTICPCPVCSMIGCMVALGLQRPCIFETISTDPSTQSIKLKIALSD